MRKIIILVLAAYVLGFVSPWLASPDNGPVLYAWFNWLPFLADQWLLPESASLALALDVSVLAVQYIALFAAVVALRPMGKALVDFLSAPRHRSGLVR